MITEEQLSGLGFRWSSLVEAWWIAAPMHVSDSMVVKTRFLTVDLVAESPRVEYVTRKYCLTDTETSSARIMEIPWDGTETSLRAILDVLKMSEAHPA